MGTTSSLPTLSESFTGSGREGLRGMDDAREISRSEDSRLSTFASVFVIP